MTTPDTRKGHLPAVRTLLVHYRQRYSSSPSGATGPAAPHPGDILYWVGCVGVISALLFVATR